MALKTFEHVLILADDVDKTKDLTNLFAALQELICLRQCKIVGTKELL